MVHMNRFRYMFSIDQSDLTSPAEEDDAEPGAQAQSLLLLHNAVLPESY